MPATQRMRRSLVLLAVLALPFTAALTIRLKFPLKIYEIALMGAGLVCLLEAQVPTVRSARRAVRPLAAFALWALAVLLLHAWFPPAGQSAAGFASRFGPLGDGVAKLIYLLLAVLGFLLVARRTWEEPKTVVRCWLVGGLVATIYAWYLFVSSFVGLPPLLLPGITSPQLFGFAGRVVIRSGTFEEGNFFGLFLLLSAALALYARRPVAAAWFSVTVLITFSTVNFVGLILLWVGVYRGRLAGLSLGRRLLYSAGVLSGGLVLGLVLLSTSYVQTVVVAKLGGEAPVSKLERLGLALSGLRMAEQHPVTGVGLSQYGYYYQANEVINLGPLSNLSEEKRIPNNVYVELLSETGLVGTMLFGLFVWSVFARTAGPAMRPLRMGLLVMFLVWNAFPSYTLMFLWAYFGVILGLAGLPEGATGAPGARPGTHSVEVGV